jgi:hypothetical protein
MQRTQLISTRWIIWHSELVVADLRIIGR